MTPGTDIVTATAGGILIVIGLLLAWMGGTYDPDYERRERHVFMFLAFVVGVWGGELVSAGLGLTTNPMPHTLLALLLTFLLALVFVTVLYLAFFLIRVASLRLLRLVRR